VHFNTCAGSQLFHSIDFLARLTPLPVGSTIWGYRGSYYANPVLPTVSADRVGLALLVLALAIQQLGINNPVTS
jgi:hypothetical protein